MALSAAAAQAIGAGASASSNLLGSLLGFIGQRRANRTNLQIAREANKLEMDLFNLSNAYNAPTAQMQRLKQAGLNPHLVYGSGSVTGNVTKKPQVHMATVQNELKDLALSKLTDTIGMYQDLRVKQAQINNIEAVTSVREQQAINEAFRAMMLKYEGQSKKVKATVAKELEKTQIAIGKANLEKALNINKNLGFDAGMKELELELNKGLKPYNMTSKDAFLFRMLMNINKNKEKFKEYWFKYQPEYKF